MALDAVAWKWEVPSYSAQAERQRQATRPGPVVRGTFSPARAWRPAVVARLPRTLGLALQPSLIHVAEADPQSPEALALLRLAAIEARALYPDLHSQSDPWPTNDPTPSRGVYLLAELGGRVVGMGAHRPLTAESSELRRMYVHRDFRRHGVARVLLAKLEAHARGQGFSLMRLETGNRQAPAMALYESCGFVQIAPFGAYANDPSSVCYEKLLIQQPPSEA